MWIGCHILLCATWLPGPRSQFLIWYTRLKTVWTWWNNNNVPDNNWKCILGWTATGYISIPCTLGWTATGYTSCQWTHPKLEKHPWLNINWKQISVTVTKGVLRQTNCMMKLIYAQTYMWWISVTSNWLLRIHSICNDSQKHVCLKTYNN